MNEFGPETLALGAIWYAAFLFSVTVHEASHAFAALKLGDPTAYEGGQVTLNPLPHLQREPFGMGLLPIISYLVAGWPIGWASAPYDPMWADRHPKRAAWMALAGPASNLILVVVSALLIRGGMAIGWFQAPSGFRQLSDMVAATGGGTPASLATLLSVMFSLNLILFVFNLLPLPPLDGSAIMPLLIGEENGRRYQDFLRQPGFGLIGLLLAWRLFEIVFDPVHLMAINLLYPGAGYTVM